MDNKRKTVPPDRDAGYTGDAGHDGYTCIARRPKVPYGPDGWIDEADADAMEHGHHSYPVPWGYRGGY